MQVIDAHVVLDLDPPQPERIRATPIHSTFASDGAPIAGLSSEVANGRILIAERVGDNVHASPKQLSELSPRS
jgi:hypothetical protein